MQNQSQSLFTQKCKYKAVLRQRMNISKLLIKVYSEIILRIIIWKKVINYKYKLFTIRHQLIFVNSHNYDIKISQKNSCLYLYLCRRTWKQVRTVDNFFVNVHHHTLFYDSMKPSLSHSHIQSSSIITMISFHVVLPDFVPRTLLLFP